MKALLRLKSALPLTLVLAFGGSLGLTSFALAVTTADPWPGCASPCTGKGPGPSCQGECDAFGICQGPTNCINDCDACCLSNCNGTGGYTACRSCCVEYNCGGTTCATEATHCTTASEAETE